MNWNEPADRAPARSLQVHNGIEYGDMQLIGEAALIARAEGLGALQLADLFTEYNDGPLGGFLIEITVGATARSRE